MLSVDTMQQVSHNDMKQSNIVKIVSFCERENLVLLADEVYQVNSYSTEHPFESFRKVVKTMKSKVQLISFQSTSKGFSAE